jgi:hypothetical protein
MFLPRELHGVVLRLVLDDSLISWVYHIPIIKGKQYGVAEMYPKSDEFQDSFLDYSS